MAWQLCFGVYIKNNNSSQIKRDTDYGDATLHGKLVQRQYFPEEIDSLSDGCQVKGNSKLANLPPVVIKGTIHVGGRIQHAPIPFDAVHPMMLPNNHPISTIIVCHYYETLGHAG